MLTALLALSTLTAACGPNRDVDVGLKEGTTDIVYGGPTTTTTLPPPPPEVAAISPGFPTFLGPPPPPLSTNRPRPPEPEIIPDPCPITPLDAKPIAALPQIDGMPAEGDYVYSGGGEFRTGKKATEIWNLVDTYPAVTDRTVKKTGEDSYDVIRTDFAATRTNSYRLVREFGSSSTNGLYLTRITMTRADGGVELFEPLQPGLLVFPEPVAAGTTWRSAATDAIRATSMILDGKIEKTVSYDMCGVRVEGWEARASITVKRPGVAANNKDFVETAVYVVATQFGGLLLGDSSDASGEDKGTFFRAVVYGSLTSLVPRETQ